MFSYLLIFVILVSTTFSDFETDLQRIKEEYTCYPNCTFNYTEINSETAKLFPSSCYSICGLITINENTDVSFATLEKLFHRMYTLKGGLRIENTTLRSFSFLQLHGFLSFFCFPFGTRIVNNTELVDAEALENIVHVSNTSHECKMEILDNSKLDASRLCESQFHNSVQNIEVLDNGKDCGCSSGKITPRNLPDFKNCIVLFDGLVLTNMSYNSNLKSLSKIANIRGNVEIAYTNFKDLSFLKSLSKIRGNTFENLETVILDIHDNPKMKRLGLDSVSVDTLEQDWVPTMNLENLHPDFCITYQEAVSLSYVRFKNLEAKFCETEWKTDMKSCKFKSLRELESDCIIIYGNVLISSGDEEYVEKLEDTVYIFGSLTIQNSELENIRFLKMLGWIYFLHETLPVIHITNNKDLKKVSLPSIVY
ncbi:Protein CBG01502 [Caenorhabditis briggsae]|uniref:Protein CBG01502 n=1 Tax=Caenorhabditis briggsae TaxID=6238 RepID=A8WQJ5_CAEBR|nr:Protein CBG01502 [Caenorhabditis briggsae]CAP22753.2 Protein CBG01502 [Caenorhabditis briggsae]